LEPNRFRLVEGAGEQDAVAARVWHEVEPMLRKK